MNTYGLTISVNGIVVCSIDDKHNFTVELESTTLDQVIQVLQQGLALVSAVKPATSLPSSGTMPSTTMPPTTTATTTTATP